MNRINRYLYWNMGYHLEHHIFPMAPYYNLPKLHALLKSDTPPPYNGLIEAYREIIPALIRQSKDPDYYVQRPLPAPTYQAAARQAAQVVTSATESDAAGWVEVCDLGLLVPGDVLRFEHGGKTYAIYRTALGQLFSTAGICNHGNAHLTDGFLHGLAYDAPASPWPHRHTELY